MSEDLEKLSYKEALRLVIKILDEQGNQIKSLDDRERLIQKALERIAGREEGKKEAKKTSRADWKHWLGIIGLVITAVALAADWIFKLWPK